MEQNKVYVLTKVTDNTNDANVLGVYTSGDKLYNDLTEWLDEYYDYMADGEYVDCTKEEYIENVVENLKCDSSYYDECFNEKFGISIQNVDVMY